MLGRQATLAVAMAVLGPDAADAADGVTEINQASALAGGVTAGDDPGFPVSLDTSGNFALTSDLIVPNQNTRGIEITATPVAIDLNGFAIRGPVTCPGSVPLCSPIGTGVGIYSNQYGTRVRGGVIQGLGAFGLSLAAGARVEDVTLTQNGTGGVAVAAASLISGCTITNNGGPGVSVSYGSRVASNVIFRNAGLGITFTSAESGYGGNVIRENNGADTNAQVSINGLQLGPNVCGADLACP